MNLATEEGNISSPTIVDDVSSKFTTMTRVQISSEVINFMTRHFTLVSKGIRGKSLNVYSIPDHIMEDFLSIEHNYQENCAAELPSRKITIATIKAVKAILSIIDKNDIFDSYNFAYYVAEHYPELRYHYDNGTTLRALSKLQRAGFVTKLETIEVIYPKRKYFTYKFNRDKFPTGVINEAN